MFETKIAFLFCLKGDQIFLFFYNYDYKKYKLKYTFDLKYTKVKQLSSKI